MKAKHKVSWVVGALICAVAGAGIEHLRHSLSVAVPGAGGGVQETVRAPEAPVRIVTVRDESAKGDADRLRRRVSDLEKALAEYETARVQQPEPPQEAEPGKEQRGDRGLCRTPHAGEVHVDVQLERLLGDVPRRVAAAEEPVLVRVQNVQHLATPIRAQLAEPVPTLELAGRLHPTPAVGGEPHDRATPLIPALEGLDRGWYAGAVGWTDLAEDGELCVALRCALLRDRLARLYAGCGIVADSVPADELAETEVKLQALLPLLT